MAGAAKSKRQAKRSKGAAAASDVHAETQVASRKGRSRLSSIDTLPEEAEPAVMAAMEALKERKLTQAEILRRLNADLEKLGIGIKPISKSAFNRKALWLASYGKQLENAREIASVWAEKLDETPDGDVGMLLGETIKTLIFDVLSEVSMSKKAPSMVMLGVASEALRNLEKARELSVATRVRIETNFLKAANKAVEKAGKEKGLTKDTISAIKSQILGVRAPASEARA